MATRDITRFGRAKQRENARSHSQAGDDNSSPGDPCRTAVAWLCRTASDATPKFVSAATSSPNYPHGQELGLSNRNCHSDDTVPEKEPHSNRFNLSVAQKPTHCLPLLQQTVEDAILDIYMLWQRPHLCTTVTKSHVVFSSLTFQSADELDEQQHSQPEVSSMKLHIGNM